MLRGELAGVLGEMIGARTELLAVMHAMDNARKGLQAERGRILQEKEILEEVVDAAKRDVESSRKQLAHVESVLLEAEQDKARMMARLEEVTSHPPSPQRSLEEARVVREEMEQELEATRHALQRAEVEVARARADAEERVRAEADRQGEAYQEAERRCSELEASNEKLQGELRKISSELEDKVREMAGLTQGMASLEQGKLPELETDRERERAADEARQLENVRLREEAGAQRLELQQLNVVRDRNRTLSDNLAALSHELKVERDSNRTKAAETAEAMQALEAQKAALKLQVSSACLWPFDTD